MRVKNRSCIVLILILSLILSGIPMGGPSFAENISGFTANTAYDVEVGYSPVTDQYLVVALQTDGDGIMTLGAQFLDSSGAPVGAQIPIAVDIDSDQHIDVAYDNASDTYCIVWTDFDQEMGASTVWGTIISSSGSMVMSSQVLAESYVEQFSDTKVVYNEYSEMFNVLFRVFSELGSAYSGIELAADYVSPEPFFIETNGGLYDIVYNPGTYLVDVAYEYSGSLIKHATVASGGAIDVVYELLSQNSNTTGYPAIGFNGMYENFYSVWQDYAVSPVEIIGQNGTDKTSESTLYTSSLSETITGLEIESLGYSGNQFVYWESNVSSDQDIYGLFADSTGSVTSSAFQITTGTNSYTCPSAVYNPNDLQDELDDVIFMAYISSSTEVVGSSVEVAFIDKSATGDTTTSELNFAYKDVGAEEGNEIEVEILRTGSTTGEVSVDIDTIADTADETDYTPVSTTITFADGEDYKYLTITTTEDDAVEYDDSYEDECFTIELSNPVGDAVLGENSVAKATIYDDDTAFSFELCTYSVAEGDTLYANIYREGLIDSEQTVEVTITTGSAIDSDLDLSVYTQDIQFLAEEYIQPVIIPIINDTDVEGDETFSLSITDVPLDTTIGEFSNASVTIVDDDVNNPGTFDFCTASYSVDEGQSAYIDILRTGGTSGDVSVDMTVTSDTADEGDYDWSTPVKTIYFADGETSQTVTIATFDDTKDEGDETAQLSLNNPTSGSSIGVLYLADLNIIDNDATSTSAGKFDFALTNYSVEEGSSAAVAVTRTGGSDGSVSVDVTVSANTATSSDYEFVPITQTLTFADGDTTPQTLQIATVDDLLVEYDEYFNIALSSPTNGAELGTNTNVSVTISDNDTAFEFASTSLNYGEETTAYVNLVRSGDTMTAQEVQVLLTPGSADSSDYTYTPTTQTVQFPIGSDIQTIAVPLIDDSEIEGNETFTLSVASVPTGTTKGTKESVVITIVDNDVEGPGTFNFDMTSYSVGEGDIAQGEEYAKAYVDIYRQNGASGAVSVDVTLEPVSADQTDYDFDPLTQTVQFDDKQTYKTIIVPIKDDSTYECTESFNLKLSGPTGGASIGSNDTVTVTLYDDDLLIPVISWSANTYSVTEGADLELTIDVDVDENVTCDDGLYAWVKFKIGTSTTADANDYEVVMTDSMMYYDESEDLYSTEVDVAAGKAKIVLKAVDNSVYEGSKAFNITLVDTDEVELGTPSTATIVIVDDEVYVRDDNDRDSNTGSNNKTDNTTTQDENTNDDGADNDSDATQTAEEIVKDYSTSRDVEALASSATDKISSESSSTDEADEVFKELEDNLDTIENDTALTNALSGYINTVSTLGDAATQETKSAWATNKIIEMNTTVSKAIQKVEDSAKLIEVTEKMVQSVKAIEEEGQIAKNADLKKAVEVLAKGAMRKLGTVKTKTMVQQVGDVTEISFADEDLEQKLSESVGNINKVKETFGAYYGEENIRDFKVEITLEAEKVSDQVKVKIDQNTLDTLDRAGVDTVGIKVGGAKLLIDKETYQPQVSERPREVAVDMNFKAQTFDSEDEKVKFKKGYTTDVNVTLDGEKRETLEKPARLSFNLDEFEFWDDNAGPSRLSVFRLNETTGDWEPVGGVYDPVTNSLSTRRISFSQYTVMQSNKTFNDVEASWAKDEINELLNKGIVDDEVAFNPEETISREEFTTWVARAYGLTNESAQAPFTDLDMENDHYTEVASAYSAGIISGSGGTFNPDEAITKEQMSAILANAMTNYDDKILTEGVEAELAQATDQDLISDWAGDDMALLLELGVLDIENGNLDPQATMTKEQAAAYLKKIYG